MAHKRSARDWCPTLEQQQKQLRAQRVNPFPLMMDAAARQQAQQQQHQHQHQQHLAAANSTTQQQACVVTLCSHCSVGLSELQVQQCHACKAVYCSSCSVLNYDEREDRIFCLDCCVNTSSDDCSTMQLTSCEASMFDQDQQQQDQQQFFGSPGGRAIVGGCSSSIYHTSSQQQQQALSAERRSSVMRACNMAAAAAAAAADSGGSCMAAMAGISGLRQEQMTPLFAQGGLCGMGCSGGGGRGSAAAAAGAGGGGGGAGVLGQWDLNRVAGGTVLFQATPASPAVVLPFAAGC